MKVANFFVPNRKEINHLLKLKLPLNKTTKKLLLSQNANGKSTFYSLVQNFQGKILERVFAVRKRKNKDPEFQEVIRRIEGNSEILVKNMYFSATGGYQVVWPDSRPAYYLFNMLDDFDEWLIYDYKYYKVFVYYLFDLQKLIDIDPTLKYCSWECQHIIDYITIYRKYPEIEMLSKLHILYLMYNTRVLEKLKYKKFKKFIFDNRVSIAMGVAKSTDVLYGFSHNLPVHEAVFHRRNLKEITTVLKAFPQLSKEKLLKYFVNYSAKHNYQVPLSAESYLDMLRAEKYLHLDLTKEKNVFPHDFDYWHRFYTNQYETAKNKTIDEGMAKQSIKYHKLEKEVENLKITLATCSQDLINEGEALHHCVGRMDYNKKMAEEKSLILFVRKEQDKPLYTMEFDPLKRKIIQFYGENDKPVPVEDRKIIDTKWLPKIKRLKFS